MAAEGSYYGLVYFVPDLGLPGEGAVVGLVYLDVHVATRSMWIKMAETNDHVQRRFQGQTLGDLDRLTSAKIAFAARIRHSMDPSVEGYNQWRRSEAGQLVLGELRATVQLDQERLERLYHDTVGGAERVSSYYARDAQPPKAEVLWEGKVPLDDGDTIRGRVVADADGSYVGEVFTTDAMDEDPAWRQVAAEGHMGTIMGTAIRDLLGRKGEAPTEASQEPQPGLALGGTP